uniref:Uncharacterized protein n=1 Tax=Timema bartmani TaxID=61472 RepID=A0A7R9F3G9_9NEOP|nr:unnamed protein product [Timema bartmani]
MATPRTDTWMKLSFLRIIYFVLVIAVFQKYGRGGLNIVPAPKDKNKVGSRPPPPLPFRSP